MLWLKPKGGFNMPNTDLFDRAEGYGHTAGTQATKDDADWDTLPTVLADREESLNDRLERSVDAKHAGPAPDDYDMGQFIGDDPDEYRRSVGPEWDESGHALVQEGPRPALTYVGENQRLDVQSTEAAVYNRPVNAWDIDDANGDQAKGDGLMDAEEHAGYREHDTDFDVELSDPNDSTEESDPKPAITALAPTLAGGQPSDVFDINDANLDPED
jgi:hypothetical protein